MASFPQPRPRMTGTGITPDDALRALRSMESISNVGNLSDEGLDIAQGLGDFQPSEAELMGAQLRAPGGISREQIRKGTMSKVKQMLRMQGAEQAQKLELGQQKVDAETQARAAQNEAIAARQREMAEMQGAERAASREDAQAFAASQQAERLAAQQNNPQSAQRLPTDQLNKQLASAQDYYGGVRGKLARMVGFDGGRREVQSSLENILHRAGSLQPLQDAVNEAKGAGMNAQQAIAEAQNQGVQLDPYEKQYLELLLGN